MTITTAGLRVVAGVRAMLIALALLAPGISAGQMQPAPSRSPAATTAPREAGVTRLTAPDAEAWLDGFMPYALDSGGVPGAVVVIVKDGRVLLEKGYGVADVATGRLVDPRTTLFRMGSVSKLFTWTAVMQLVEQRRLDLDADVNRYLDFRIPPFAGQPITMRQLMTHTAGFEEARRGIATLDPRAMTKLGDTLRRDLPARVYAPGTTPAYSNYGAALAGYIVQRVSGEPFDDYVERHNFLPLGMRHSTFREPLPASLAGQAALGYRDATSPPGRFELVSWQPAGGMSATGDDLARFMIAHLQDGAFGNTRILSAATARVMHRTANAPIPGLNRMALGFYEKNINGRRVIAHAGDTVLFHSLVALFPAENVGLFMSFNAAGTHGAVSQIREQLFDRFADRYLPNIAAPDRSVDAATARAHNRMFASVYFSSRSSSTAFMTATKLLFPVRIVLYPDNSVSLSGYKGPNGEAKRFREIAPFVWREVGGHDRLAGIVKNGRIVRLSTDDLAPVTVFDAGAAWASPVVLMPLFLLGALSLAALLLAWPAAALVRHHYGVPNPHGGARARAERLMRATAAIALAAIAGWLWLLSQITDPVGIYQLADKTGLIYLIEVLTITGFVGALLAAGYLLAVIWRGSASWAARFGSAVLLVGVGGMVYTAWLYRLLTISAAF